MKWLPAAALLALLACVPQARADQVVVDASVVSSLDRKLQAFSAGLPAAERSALAGLMLGAAGAPDDNPMNGVAVSGRMARASQGIIVQGGLIVQGGREAIGPKQDDPRAPVLSRSAIQAIGPKQDDPRTPQGSLAIGPKQDDPRTPQGSLAIGPKQDDPRAPVLRTGALAIGPKQDDPRAAVRGKLAEFAKGLSLAEAATLDWMLGRADKRPDVGGIPPEEGPNVVQALGIAPLAIGPKQDDPAPPPPAGFETTLTF